MAPPDSSKAKVRPLIQARAVNAFGSAREHTHDLTYVEGYSDKRRQIDDDLRQKRESSTSMPYRLHWVTNQKPSGRPDMQKVTQFRAQGYKPVAFASPPEGIVIPAHATKTPEGFVQNGDTLLMYCDAATAHGLYEEGRSAIEERTTDEYTSNTLHAAGSELGGVGNDLATSTTQQRVQVSPRGD